jgi:hypothetical protein
VEAEKRKNKEEVTTPLDGTCKVKSFQKMVWLAKKSRVAGKAAVVG